jgi:glucokinase
MLGIDIGGTKIEAAVATADGTIVRRARIQTHAERGPAQAIERIARLARTVGGDAAIRAYAAVCPGVVLPDQILLAPNLPGWSEVRLAQELAAALGADTVAVSNDVHAGALAELRRGALVGTDPGIYVSLGTGIGSALTVAGKVVSGAHHASGEIGYMVPIGADLHSIKPDDAPLEEIVGGGALGRWATSVLGSQLSAQELFARRDDDARALVHRALDQLAAAIANVAVALDPERIAIGGGMMSSAGTILPVIAEALQRIVPFPPDLVTAHFTVDASLHGAVALAIDSVFDGPGLVDAVHPGPAVAIQ